MAISTHLRALGVLLLLPLAAAAQGVELNTISAVRVRGGTVEIVGSKRPNFTTFTMTDPSRLVIDISEAVFAGVPEDIQVGNGTITAIRTASYGSDASAIARVLVGFEREVETDIQTREGTIVIKVGGAEAPAVAEAPATPEVREPAHAPAAGERQAGLDAEQAAKAAREEQRAQQQAAEQAAKAAEQDRLAQQQAAEQAAKAAQEEQRAQQQAAADAAKAAEAERQRVAEQQRVSELERTRQLEEQARREAQAAAESAEAERQKKREEAQAAAEQKKRQQEEARASAQEERERKREEARAAAEEKAAAQKEARAAALAERERKREEAQAAAEERKRQQEEARAQRLAMAEERRAPAAATSGGEATGRRTSVELVGFQQEATTSRVFVRTGGPVRYSVTPGGERSLVLELENTSLGAANNGRPLDTSFFDTAVARVDPEAGPGRTVRVQIQLKEAVPYEARQEGNTVVLEFPRPGRR